MLVVLSGVQRIAEYEYSVFVLERSRVAASSLVPALSLIAFFVNM